MFVGIVLFFEWSVILSNSYRFSTHKYLDIKPYRYVMIIYLFIHIRTLAIVTLFENTDMTSEQ